MTPTTRWTVGVNHPFFEEVRATFASQIGHFAVAAYQAMYEQCGRILDEFTAMIKQHVCVTGRNLVVQGDIRCVNLSNMMSIGQEGCDEVVRLLQTRDYAEYLLGERSRPTSFTFELVSCNQLEQELEAERQRPTVREKEGTTVGPTAEHLLWPYSLGAKYEEYKDALVRRYGGFRSYPPLLQMFRLIRNGCFHQNTFNIVADPRGPQIDPRNPPTWRSFVMTDDAAVHGGQVIGGFLKAPYVLPFMAEVGDALLAALRPEGP